MSIEYLCSSSISSEDTGLFSICFLSLFIDVVCCRVFFYVWIRESLSESNLCSFLWLCISWDGCWLVLWICWDNEFLLCFVLIVLWRVVCVVLAIDGYYVCRFYVATLFFFLDCFGFAGFDEVYYIVYLFVGDVFLNMKSFVNLVITNLAGLAGDESDANLITSTLS